MAPLALLLIVKIGVTAGAVALPFLVLSKAMLDRLSGFGSSSLTLYRLYGVAILALLAAYIGGLVQTLGGTFPWPVVVMGLVSNAGATLILIRMGQGPIHSMGVGVFGLIALGFLVTLILPGQAMAPLW